MDDLPCGFGEEPIIFQPDAEIEALQKEGGLCQTSQCCGEVCKSEKCEPEPVQKSQLLVKETSKIKSCFKCKKQPGAVLYKGESMCKACSLRNVEYKCRINLQNKIKLVESDQLVVCLSGGMNSLCLANILFELQKKFQKHLLFKSIECVHIDLTVLSDFPKHYTQKVSRLRDFAQDKGVQLTIISLTQLVGEEELAVILSGFGEAANQSDIVELFIRKLVQSHYPKQIIALGTSGQRTASNILKYIVKGQGGSLEELGWRHDNFVLPLRQHLTKQIQFYFHMNNLDRFSFEPPSLFSTKLQQMSSIDDVVEDFIDSLQTDYSHTCPTILRTSQKIQKTQKGSRCSFCQSFTNDQDKRTCRRCQRLQENWESGSLPSQLFPKGFLL